jgi:hypothetical protein
MSPKLQDARRAREISRRCAHNGLGAAFLTAALGVLIAIVVVVCGGGPISLTILAVLSLIAMWRVYVIASVLTRWAIEDEEDDREHDRLYAGDRDPRS